MKKLLNKVVAKPDTHIAAFTGFGFTGGDVGANANGLMTMEEAEEEARLWITAPGTAAVWDQSSYTFYHKGLNGTRPLPANVTTFIYVDEWVESYKDEETGEKRWIAIIDNWTFPGGDKGGSVNHVNSEEEAEDYAGWWCSKGGSNLRNLSYRPEHEKSHKEIMWRKKISEKSRNTRNILDKLTYICDARPVDAEPVDSEEPADSEEPSPMI